MKRLSVSPLPWQRILRRQTPGKRTADDEQGETGPQPRDDRSTEENEGLGTRPLRTGASVPARMSVRTKSELTFPIVTSQRNPCNKFMGTFRP